MTDSYEVVVAGGGPVGMWLAAELGRAGISVIVLEKRAERPPQSKLAAVLADGCFLLQEDVELAVRRTLAETATPTR